MTLTHSNSQIGQMSEPAMLLSIEGIGAKKGERMGAIDVLPIHLTN